MRRHSAWGVTVMHSRYFDGEIFWTGSVILSVIYTGDIMSYFRGQDQLGRLRDVGFGRESRACGVHNEQLTGCTSILCRVFGVNPRTGGGLSQPRTGGGLISAPPLEISRTTQRIEKRETAVAKSVISVSIYVARVVIVFLLPKINRPHVALYC